MRINHNMAAANAHRVLNVNSKDVSKSMEKLSSGYRINRAGDDAAGLSISEKMRAQLRGINQAARNAQDGISLIQTAEGATNEVHSLLQRGRELAVQSANDTNVTEDREALQQEINSIIAEVDRIANNTEFNTQKLLDSSGSVNKYAGAIATLDANIEEWLNDSLVRLRDDFGIAMPASAVDMNIDYYDSPSTGEGASMGTSDGGASLSLRINLANVTDGSGNLFADDTIDRLIAHEMMHGLQFTDMAFATDGDTPSGELWIIEGMAMAIQGGNNFGTIDASSQIDTGWTGSLQNYADAYAAVKTLHEITTGGLGAFIDRLELGDTLDQAFANTVQGNSAEGGASQITLASDTIGSLQNFIDWYNGTAPDNYLDNSSDFTSPTGSIDDATVQGNDGSLSVAASVPNLGVTTTLDANFNVTNNGFGNPSGAVTEIRLHIGADSSQTMAISKANMQSSALGIDAVSVTDHNSASDAIDSFDVAIGIVSDARSYFGAAQNRLEHTIDNLNNSHENLQSAESRIRDVNMADEMMTYTAKNILIQATQSMLAQANQGPQSVLQLLG